MGGIENVNKETAITCLLCGKEAVLAANNYNGYREGDNFSIYHCDNCNTAFSYPRIDSGYIYDLIYRNGSKVPGYDRYYKYFDTVKSLDHPLDYLAESELESTYWGIREHLSKKQVKSAYKIIEIGSGLGYLTYSLNKEGYNAIGMDISSEAVNKARENFGETYVCADLAEYAKFHKEEYDFVILTELIEHVENPIIFLKYCMQMLKNRGEIILTTPNKTIFSKKIVWNTDLPPVHIWWFSEESMRYIAAEINATVEFIDYTNYFKNKSAYIDTNKDFHHNPVFDKENCLLPSPPPNLAIYLKSNRF
jgi:SAM-dependent methyltransferase